MKIKIKRNGVNHVVEVAEHWIHILYCGVVFIEAHGFYGYVAGGLGMVAFVHIITGGKVENGIHCDLE